MQGETTLDSVKTEIVPQTQAHPHSHTSALFDHEHRPYQPRNVNLLHEAEQKAAGVNTKIAVALTRLAAVKHQGRCRFAAHNQSRP
jgi:hypothetical protein